MPAVFRKLITTLNRHYGDPKLPPARGPFELVLWENACYLLSDERRAEAFEGLRQHVGLDPEAIWKASDDVLFPLARLGGMRPDVRVMRWRQIARLTLDRHGGDLGQILQRPYAEASRALQQYPNIGGPGAEKILLFCGAVTSLPLEWNGVRVLTRMGYGTTHKSYGATYRSVQENLQAELPGEVEYMPKAHLLLREHGKTLCREKRPQCHACPAARFCAYAVAEASRAAK
jgi:endonuclease-3